METQLFWIVALLVLVAVGVGFFSLGTRTRKPVTRGDCEVRTWWWFGWWVGCRGGKACPSGSCKLQYNAEGMSHWADADAPSMAWKETTLYRCVCA